jgi:hypothetical protein
MPELPSSELKALQDFYHATGGDSWTNNDGWMNNTKPCEPEWYGLQCSSTNDVYAIKSIILSNNNLISPQLPSSISQLTNLTLIDLSTHKTSTTSNSAVNSLGGTIPKAMCNLQMTQFMNFSGHHFNGSFPECFSSLTAIDTIDFSSEIGLSGCSLSF